MAGCHRNPIPVRGNPYMVYNLVNLRADNVRNICVTYHADDVNEQGINFNKKFRVGDVLANFRTTTRDNKIIPDYSRIRRLPLARVRGVSYRYPAVLKTEMFGSIEYKIELNYKNERAATV